MRLFFSAVAGVSALVATTAAMLFAASGASALTIPVNTTSDDYGSTPATCSLREAITSAATDGSFGGCDPGSGADTIRVPPGNYSVTRPGVEDLNSSGDFDLKGNQPLTIEPAGGGAKVMIDGSGIDRVFHVQDSVPLTLRNVTVSGGLLAGLADGGGILNASAGLLSLEGVTVRDNSATVGGGGIASYSQLSMVNSTVSGNGSEQSGGGLYLPGGSTATVTSSTIADNTADSNADGNGDGGGFVGGATSSVNFHNVINALNRDLSPNPGDQSPDCSSGPFYFPRFTLSSQAIGSGACLVGFAHPGNKVEADPGLAPLADNGGQTPTHALLAGSPAIGAGGTVAPDQCPPIDQNGRNRPAGSCDIGAVQFVPAPVTARVAIRKVLPNKKVAGAGKVIRVRVVVRNSGAATARAVKVCLRLKGAAKKALATRGKACRRVGNLPTGGTKKPKIALAAKNRAKRKSYRVVARVSGKNFKARSRSFRVKVR